MATSREVASFLQSVAARNVTTPLPDPEVNALAQAGLVQRFSEAEMQQAQQEIAQLEQQRAALAQENFQRGNEAARVVEDTRRTHSILFHLHGVDAQQAVLERLQKEQAAIQSLDEDLARRQQLFSQLLVKKSLVDQAGPYAGGYVALTTAGRTALRDLNVRLYRVGDQPFADYWVASQRIDGELVRIATQSATLATPLAQSFTTVDRSYLWAVAIGLVKLDGDPQQRLRAFTDAYAAIGNLGDNVEDRLMAAELVAGMPPTVPPATALLPALRESVIAAGVPAPVALGVGAILLAGRRADGSFALDHLGAFLQKTRSYESAAMLAIINRPVEELSAKFDYLRGLFAGWGYALSEDTELSSAYLAASELPANSISAKLSILARGLSAYLEYPLVGAAILASIPVLEANETLNLVEKAYEILGRRTGPMTQAELISLAVRMVHGVEVVSVDELDPTARALPASVRTTGFGPNFWIPIIIIHHGYYATFSGIGGVHPGHIHAWGGGGFG
jgi:hypothetical protein